MDKTLLLMCGMQCSGKSTLSKRLSSELSIELISTDDVRVRLFENPGIMNANPLDRYFVYYQTLEEAKKPLSNGQSVIIDGTFSIKTYRDGAYHLAWNLEIPVYLIECICNNYGIVQQRYQRREEQKKEGTHLFDEWTTIGPYHKMFQKFERLDREALPDGRPVPIIRYDSEISRAEIVFSDGSRNIEEIVEAINNPIVQEKKAVGYLRGV